ncbi:MAG: galactokinase family protein, partial [Anaerolineae bacterium]|nr:galactokinase family protein [Anaerolineae bacterium]
MHIIRAPLRISPLGAHVDHQDGFVTGMTIDRAIFLVFTPRDDRQVIVHSLNFPGTVSFNLGDIPPSIPGDWGNYVRGAASALQTLNPLDRGMNAVVGGVMPIGGLSSSAAVGVAYLLALEYVNGLQITPVDNVELDRFIENNYLGLRNGVLDQSIILLSERNHLTYLDCRSMQVDRVPLGEPHADLEFLVVYSGVDKALVGTDYNLRVTQCQQAAEALLLEAGEPVPSQPRLREVPESIYAAYSHKLPEILQKRARHFFTEIQRVKEGVAAWRTGDIPRVGQLIKASGASSIYNYESGCDQLKTLYDILGSCPG